MAPKRKTDKQLFKQHRRRIAKDAGAPLTAAAVEAAWKVLTALEKIAEPRRIRSHLRDGTALEDVPLEEPQPEVDNYNDSSGESNISDTEVETGVVVSTSDTDVVDSDPNVDPNVVRTTARRIFGDADALADNADGTTWQHQGEVGAGVCGTAHIWVSVNGAGKITARVVIKNAWISEADSWGSVKCWHGDPRDAADRTPVEVFAMREMQNKPGSHSVVGFHAFSVDDARMAYRIIMPYYAHGSLLAMVLAHRRAASAPRIPEPFIWSVFEAMIEACLLMENGTSAKTATPPAEWHQIVHKDISLGNTWLDARRADWPSYPHAVMGDFGRCILTWEGDIMNPNHYADDMGTKGYMAPEQSQFVNSVTQEKQLLSRLQGWTNVYGVGRTIQCLMQKQLGGMNGPRWAKGYEARGDMFDHAEQNYYSRDLRSLVQKCTRYLPQKRITARRLKGKILRRTAGTGAGGLDLANGRRTTAVPLQWLIGWEQTDRYAIGLTIPPAAAA